MRHQSDSDGDKDLSAEDLFTVYFVGITTSYKYVNRVEKLDGADDFLLVEVSRGHWKERCA